VYRRLGGYALDHKQIIKILEEELEQRESLAQMIDEHRKFYDETEIYDEMEMTDISFLKMIPEEELILFKENSNAPINQVHCQT
jgi:hypothetical protein